MHIKFKDLLNEADNFVDLMAKGTQTAKNIKAANKLINVGTSEDPEIKSISDALDGYSEELKELSVKTNEVRTKKAKFFKENPAIGKFFDVVGEEFDNANTNIGYIKDLYIKRTEKKSTKSPISEELKNDILNIGGLTNKIKKEIETLIEEYTITTTSTEYRILRNPPVKGTSTALDKQPKINESIEKDQLLLMKNILNDIKELRNIINNIINKLQVSDIQMAAENKMTVKSISNFLTNR